MNKKVSKPSSTMNKFNKENQSQNNDIGKDSLETNVIFKNQEKIKNQMKTMIRNSVDMHEFESSKLGNISQNNNLNNTSLFPQKSRKTTIDIRQEKISELGKLNELAEKVFGQQNKMLKNLVDENQDTKKLIEYYKKQIAEEKRIYEDMEAEEKKVKFREELQIQEAQEEIRRNMQIIQNLKSQCLVYETELTTKEVILLFKYLEQTRYFKSKVRRNKRKNKFCKHRT
jgi:hypothetical protein